MKQTILIQISEAYLKFALMKEASGCLEADVPFIEPILGLNDAQISAKIKDALKKLKIHQYAVVLSVPRNAATVRNLHLPSQQKEEIEQMIDLKLVRIVPYKKEDIVSAYRLIDKDESGYARVILAVVKSELVRRYMTIIEKAGGVVDRIVLGSFGVWKNIKAIAAAEQKPGDIFLALDVDTEFTDFVIFSTQNIIFTASINIGARALIENRDGVAAKFIAELKQFLMLFYNEEANRKPAKVFLCGAMPPEGFSQRISSELAIPVMQTPAQAATLPPDVSSASMTKIGARWEDEISFVLPEIQIRKSLVRTVRDLILFGGLFIYLLTLGYVFYWVRIYNQENYITKINEEARSIETSLGDLPQKLKKTEFVKERLETRKAPLFVIIELQKIVPEKVAIVSIVLDNKGKAAVRGQAEDLPHVFKFIDNLEKEKLFKDVQTKSTKKKRTGDRDLIDFELTFNLITDR